MLNPELLAMLVCPETHQDLVQASPDEVARLNRAIGDGEVSTMAGKGVSELVDGALIRADRRVAYPVRDDIPVMLVVEGIDFQKLNLALESAPAHG